MGRGHVTRSIVMPIIYYNCVRACAQVCVYVCVHVCVCM